MASSQERLEWVEIIEPRSKQQMYVNLTTGQCLWEPPVGAKVRHTDDNQWWELFDANTSRYYYYNVATQQTVWHRPSGVDIIPLGKLQNMKLNTEVKGKKQDSGTQTIPPFSKSLPISYHLSPSSPSHSHTDTQQQQQRNSFKEEPVASSNVTPTLPRSSSCKSQSAPTERANEKCKKCLEKQRLKQQTKEVVEKDGDSKPMSPLIMKFGLSNGSQHPISGLHAHVFSGRPPHPSESQEVTHPHPTSTHPSTQQHSSSTPPHLPSTQHYPPSTQHHPPSTQHHSPSTQHHPPSTQHHSPSTQHHPPTTQPYNPSTQHYSPSTQHQNASLAPVTLEKNKPKMIRTNPQVFYWNRPLASNSDVGPQSTLHQFLLEERRRTHQTQPQQHSDSEEEIFHSYISEEEFADDEDNVSAPDDMSDESSSSSSTSSPHYQQPVLLHDDVVEEVKMRALPALPSPPCVPHLHPPPHQVSRVTYAPIPQVPLREKIDPLLTIDRSKSFQTELSLTSNSSHRTASLHSTSTSEINLPAEPKVTDTLNEPQNYVPLNQHHTGLLRKKVSLEKLLSWQKEGLNNALIRGVDGDVKRECMTMFKHIQVYMCDRKGKAGSDLDTISHHLVSKGWASTKLRDELYLQICKQTRDNPNRDSEERGWQLMSICLSFFPPSTNFQNYLISYIMSKSMELNSEDHLQTYIKDCVKKLERYSQTGNKRNVRKPSPEDVMQAKISIFHVSVFGNTLEEVMQEQEKSVCEGRRLPWLQVTLSERLLEIGGAETEGIFRIPADSDDVNALKVCCDVWWRLVVVGRGPPALPPTWADAHVLASLLKQWYRELAQPLIPHSHYERCVRDADSPQETLAIISDLPLINRLVLGYLIRFLQVFALADNVSRTKMDVSNLAMVWAPNCLQCSSEDPQTILQNARKEMAFIKTLILHLDTVFIDGIR